MRRLGIRDTNVVIAVSGGADSVCLLRNLHQIADDCNLALHVGHFDHQLRNDSANDAGWVQHICDALDIPCTIGRPETGQSLKPLGGIEETARRQRYDFLLRLAVNLNANWIAVAHTANDQAETILHHLARGTGLRGLAGIPEVRQLNDHVSLVRPLLGVVREKLIADLQRRNQDFLQDSTNSDSRYTRNRIRNEVLPYLRDSLNPQIDTALRRLAQQAAHVQFAIEELASAALQLALCERSPDLVRLAREPVQTQPQAVLTAMFVELWIRQGWSRQQMSGQHWEQLATMLREGAPTGCTCPGAIQVQLHRNVIEICSKPISEA